MRTTILTAIAALALTGCKADYTGEGSIKAALAAADGKPATMTGVIGIEAGSESSCKEKAPALIDALTKEYPGATFLGCGKRDFDTFAEFRVALPVMSMQPGSSSPVPLSIGAEKFEGSVLVALYLDRRSAERVRESLPSDVTALFDGTFDITTTIDIRNDTDQPVTVSTNGAYVDGIPLPFRREHDLEPGQSMRIQPSDVHRSALASGSGAFIFGIKVDP